MPAGPFRYSSAGLGPLLFIPWLGLVTVVFLAYLLFAKPVPIVPSTLPAGYFALVLATVTTIYFFRYDWYRRQQFELTDAGLTVITARGTRRTTVWSDLLQAQFRTNTGALVLSGRAGAGALVLYPGSLEKGAELLAEIDARTSLQLAALPDLQAALQRAV